MLKSDNQFIRQSSQQEQSSVHEQARLEMQLLSRDAYYIANRALRQKDTNEITAHAEQVVEDINTELRKHRIACLYTCRHLDNWKRNHRKPARRSPKQQAAATLLSLQHHTSRKFKGVQTVNRRFFAQLYLAGCGSNSKGGDKVRSPMYDDEEQAAKAYDDLARQHVKKCNGRWTNGARFKNNRMVVNFPIADERIPAGRPLETQFVRKLLT